MKLPDLKEYRLRFIKQAVGLPLPVVPFDQNGLLRQLPAPATSKTGWPWSEESSPLIYSDTIIWPKLTIVVPSFNQSGFIEETIRSILLQNYPNLELVVMDGGSTDDTKKVLIKYSSWISYWKCEKDSGQGNAINLGFSIASGDYYAWINSDDYYLKDVFALVLGRFLKTGAEFIYGYGNSYHLKQDRLELVKMLPLSDFFIKLPSLVQPSTFWKATIHQPIWEELYCAIDFELWLRLAKAKKRSMIRQPLSTANIHDEAKTSDPGMKEKWDADEKKIWSPEGHGPVPHWHKVNRINRVRFRIYKALGLL